MTGRTVMNQQGPHGAGRMIPGRRATVMVVVAPQSQETALQEAMAWVGAFEEDCGLVMDHGFTELHAVARAADLKEPLQPPRDAAMAADIDFICVDGQWHHPDDCPSSPPDTQGAPPWAWAYYQLIMGLDDSAICTLWDLMPLPAAA